MTLGQTVNRINDLLATLEAYGDMTVEKVRATLEQLGLEVGG